MRDGPRGFTRSFTSSVLLWYPSGDHFIFTYGTFTLCGRTFQAVRLASGLVTPIRGPTTPRGKPLVWAVPLSLAATDGIDVSFFSSRY